MNRPMQPAIRTNLTDSATESLRAESLAVRWALARAFPTSFACRPSIGQPRHGA